MPGDLSTCMVIRQEGGLVSHESSFDMSSDSLATPSVCTYKSITCSNMLTKPSQVLGGIG
jgi:hypothetical protein